MPILVPPFVAPLRVVLNALELDVRVHVPTRYRCELRSSYAWIRLVLAASTHGLQLPAASIARTRNRYVASNARVYVASRSCAAVVDTVPPHAPPSLLTCTW